MYMSVPQQEILKYWTRYFVDHDQLPARADLSMRKLGRHVSDMAILEVDKNPVDFKIRLLGTSVEQFVRNNYTGSRVSAIPGNGPQSPFWQYLLHVLSNAKPDFLKVPCTCPDARVNTTGTLYLPLASDHKHMDMILLVPQIMNPVAALHVNSAMVH